MSEKIEQMCKDLGCALMPSECQFSNDRYSKGYDCDGPHVALSKRGRDWLAFSQQVLNHIEVYTVPQYGDKGEDQATEFASHDHVVQAKKYLNRYGKNSRPGQEILDLVKTAHYCQMAAMELAKELEAAK